MRLQSRTERRDVLRHERPVQERIEDGAQTSTGIRAQLDMLSGNARKSGVQWIKEVAALGALQARGLPTGGRPLLLATSHGHPTNSFVRFSMFPAAGRSVPQAPSIPEGIGPKKQDGRPKPH